MKLLSILRIPILLVLVFEIFVKAENVKVTIKNGPIVGQTIDSSYGQKVNQFLGIPYARPPIGKLRFRRPLPAERWTQPLPALEWPSNCYQKIKKRDIPFRNYNVSEDCLKINIWSPDVTVDEDSLMPVVVFFYGGGFAHSGSTFDLFDGNVLSQIGNLVVVTLNYRVSTFGFLYSDVVGDIKGNQGLWDQALALEWIQENIRYFGGDPKRVTITGSSAGSKSVSAHILSPITRNLFQNGIMFSGASLPRIISEPAVMVQSLLIGIRKVGCATAKDTSITSKVIKCLEVLDPAEIIKIPYADKSFYLFPSFLTVDGEFFPEHPVTMLANGNHKDKFNLIASTVGDEGSFALNAHGQDARFRRFNPEPITLDEAKQYLVDMMSSKLLREPVDNETIVKYYFAGLNGNFDHQNLFRRQVGIAFGDYWQACPTIEFAKRVFRSKPQSINVYHIHYNAKFGNDKYLCSEWMGTCHCDEIYPVFGMPFRYPAKYHYREQEISLQIINIVSSFAGTGHPGSTVHSEWLKFFMTNNLDKSAKSVVVAPYYEISNEVNSHKSHQFNLKQFECENIWNQYIFDRWAGKPK